MIHAVGNQATACHVGNITALASVKQERCSEVFPAEVGADTHQEIGLTVTDVDSLGRVDERITVGVANHVAVRVTHVVLA